jgi:hypothetical protein
LQALVSNGVFPSDADFLALLARYLPKEQFAPQARLRDARALLWRRRALLGGVTLMVAGITAGGVAWQQAGVWEMARQQTEAVTRSLESQYAALREAKPRDGEDKVLIDMPRAATLLSADAMTPLPQTLPDDLARFSRLLSRFPALSLSRVRWQAGKDGRARLTVWLACEKLPGGEADCLAPFVPIALAQGWQVAREENPGDEGDAAADASSMAHGTDRNGAEVDRDTQPLTLVWRRTP